MLFSRQHLDGLVCASRVILQQIRLSGTKAGKASCPVLKWISTPVFLRGLAHEARTFYLPGLGHEAQTRSPDPPKIRAPNGERGAAAKGAERFFAASPAFRPGRNAEKRPATPLRMTTGSFAVLFRGRHRPRNRREMPRCYGTFVTETGATRSCGRWGFDMQEFSGVVLRSAEGEMRA
jgi:hypothetical protein